MLITEPGDDFGETGGRGGDLSGRVRQARSDRCVGLRIPHQPFQDVADPIQSVVQDSAKRTQLRQALRLVLHRLGPESTHLLYFLAPLGQLPLSLPDEIGRFPGAGIGLERGGGNVAVLDGVRGNVNVLQNGDGM